MKPVNILRFNGHVYELVPVDCDRFRLWANEERRESPYRDIGDVMPTSKFTPNVEILCQSIQIKGQFYALMLREKKR